MQYVAFHNVHLPLEAEPEHLAQYSRGAFSGDWDRLQLAGMVTGVDAAVGRIVAKLRTAKMYHLRQINIAIVFANI